MVIWLESVGEHPMHANERMFLHAQSQDIQLENMEKVVRTLYFASFLGQIGNEEHMDHVNICLESTGLYSNKQQLQHKKEDYTASPLSEWNLSQLLNLDIIAYMLYLLVNAFDFLLLLDLHSYVFLFLFF